MKKLILTIFVTISLFGSFSFAQEYIYFYWNWCTHCAKVEKFFDANDIESKYGVEKLEIYFNRSNLAEFSKYIEKLGIDQNKAWVPFLVIDNELECKYLMWDKKIVDFFEKMIIEDQTCTDANCTDENCSEIHSEDISWTVSIDEDAADWLVTNHKKFLWIMMPAALADSINPCAFAVMLILLSTIMIETNNKKRAIFAGLLFALSIFISYFTMGLWLFSALATSKNTDIIKLIVWILWIVVWLANLKDFFRYGKWFVMEVPLSRRPKMQKLIKSVVSPIWAFFTWFLVSLFLLPCTSWPYITILGYLASESGNINTRGYIYLAIYNLIFILPMIIITFLVGLWFKSAEELASLKKKNSKLIHLVVWLLMLWLWLYVLLTM